ncbi:hypothetical protein [Tahibacter amnicola]|uniref:Uncharacterized protein n=1 Tax=Tahibacter amnicola TaxID=2976241 RepID=A0ABY6BJU8_9GAMM|nr:hypothetical protein [Tahibacter amnicola]UXI70293.1 hypothetical protein N4264_11850 [Tahibacter amnicola]
MGSFVILVVGDDYREQLDALLGEPTAEFTYKNVLADATRLFGTRNKAPLLKVAQERYGIVPLVNNREPRPGMDYGWIRFDARGAICEIQALVDPGGNLWKPRPEPPFLSYSSSSDGWLLKEGAIGATFANRGPSGVATGWAGSARKRDIALDVMRQTVLSAAGALWDAAHAVRGTLEWIPYNVFWERYQDAAEDRYKLAIDAWRSQPLVAAMRAANREFQPIPIGPPSDTRFFGLGPLWPHRDVDLDRYLLPREEFLAAYGIRQIATFYEVVRNGHWGRDVDERELFDTLADDDLLTLVFVTH